MCEREREKEARCVWLGGKSEKKGNAETTTNSESLIVDRRRRSSVESDLLPDLPAASDPFLMGRPSPWTEKKPEYLGLFRGFYCY